MSGIVGAEHGGVGGVDAFAATLKLITDKDELERRLAILQQTKEEAAKVVALAGPASEIVQMRQKLGEDLAAAKKELEQARQQAALLVDEARSRAAGITEEAKTLVEQQKQALSAAREQAASIVAEAQRQLAEVEKEREEVRVIGQLAADSKKQAERDIKAAHAIKAEYEQRERTLAAVAEQFRASLGKV